MTTAEKLYTWEEFVALPRDVIQGCELIDGRIVKKHLWDGEEMGGGGNDAGDAHSTLPWCVSFGWLWNSLRQKDSLIKVFAEALFDVGADRGRTRRPDLAVIRGRASDRPRSCTCSRAVDGG